MTNYIILALCVLVLLSYTFDITSRYTKIPGVLLLITLGIGIQFLTKLTGLHLPDMRSILPVLGTLGLILIVLEASLDLKLEKSKIRLITRSVSTALILFAVFTTLMTILLVFLMRIPLLPSLLNSIPLGIVSSSVAIPAASNLKERDREFIVFESAFSDIVGIMVFDFILVYYDALGSGILNFTVKGLLTVILAVIVTAILAMLLHKITYHVSYVIILTFVILVYVLAKMIHLPSLLLILVFGLILSNNRFLEKDFIKKYVDFAKLGQDILSFRKIMGELTFLVRSFFFIMFGYYATVSGFLSLSNILTALLVTMGIFALRWLLFVFIGNMEMIPLVFFSPRGLITILLFLSIPAEYRISLITEEVIILVILMTMIILTAGNMLQKKEREERKPVVTDGIAEIANPRIISPSEIINNEPPS